MPHTEKAPIERLRESVHNGKISDMYAVLDALATSIRERDPFISTVAWYRAIAEHIPGKIPEDIYRTLLDTGVGSRDKKSSAQAKFVYLMLNMKTVFAASERFLGRAEIDEDDVINVAVMSVLDSMPVLRTKKENLSSSVFREVEFAVLGYMVEVSGAPYRIVKHRDFFSILDTIRKTLNKYPYGMSYQQICIVAEKLDARFNIGQQSLMLFIRAQQQIYFGEDVVLCEDDMIDQTARTVAKEHVVERVRSSPKAHERHKDAVLFYYGLLDGQDDHTLEDVGVEFHVVVERARQIVAKGRRKLAMDNNLRHLYE